VPAEWNPWAPLDVKAAPNWLTGFKLMRLRNPELCAQVLSSSGLRVTAQADSPDAKCPLIGAVRVQGGEVALSSSFLASCPLAVAYAMFERIPCNPPRKRFTASLWRVSITSAACLPQCLQPRERRSAPRRCRCAGHQRFRLADGRSVSVLKDWPKQNQDAQFLRQVRDGACEAFSVVLSPDYNAAHRNHFHVDVGRWSVCR
jgi:hypothetical protein